MKNSSNNKILLEIELIKMVTEKQEEIPDSIQTPVKQTTEENKKNTTKEQEKVKEVVIESPKETKTSSTPKIDFSSTLSKESLEQLEALKKIRIHNSLVSVSQKNRNAFKEKLEDLKELLMNPDYSKLISLLFDGELKVISDKNMIFVYKTNLLAEAFNLELLELEKVFFEKFQERYRLIAVDEEEWNTIKTEYNKNKNNYSYQEEKIDIEKIFESNDGVEKKKNVIDELFENFIEYEDN